MSTTHYQNSFPLCYIITYGLQNIQISPGEGNTGLKIKATVVFLNRYM